VDPFVRQLKHLCGAYPTRSKWVIVPSHAAGHTLGDRLAREGTDWANLRFVTPLDLALRMAGPFLVERGITPSEDTLGPALMMRLLLDLPEDGGYFRPMAEQPSMGQALWRTIRDLRMAGLRAADLHPDAFTSPAKHRELTALLCVYERFLDANYLADMPAVFQEAARHLEFCPVQAADCWTSFPGVSWPPLQQRLLDALPGDRIEPESAAVPGANVPRRVPAASALAAEPRSARDAHRLWWLLRPGDAPAPFGDGSMQVFHAGGRDAEVEEIFRRVLASGLRLDEVEIACADEACASLIWEKAHCQRWPVTTAFGLPAATTRPGRALLGFCAWIEQHFDASRLRALLESGDLAPADFRQPDDGDTFSPGTAAGLLLKAEAGWGRLTYESALTRLARTFDDRASDPERHEDARRIDRRQGQRTRRLLAWVQSLLGVIPESGADGIALAELVTVAKTFLESNAARASALDAAAFVAISDSLEELLAFGAYRCNMRAALRLIREQVEGLRVGADRARPGHLSVSKLTQVGLDGRRAVFIVGLEEGAVFPTTIEDAVLLDQERARIHPSLRTSIDLLDETVSATVYRLAMMAAEYVCFSFSCRDTRAFRETFPSWLVLQAWRLKAGDSNASFESLLNGLGEPASRIPSDPAQAISDSGWWLNRVQIGRERTTPGVLEAFPSLARGVHAEEIRRTARFTEFDGYVQHAGPMLDPTTGDRVISITTLEDAAACPFRYFLKQGLGLEPVAGRDRQADLWLTPQRRGIELHAIYAAVMREVRSAGAWPPAKSFIARIRELGARRLRELRDEMPPPSEEVFARESEELLDDLELFMTQECEPRDREGVAFEVSFGASRQDQNGASEDLTSAEPVALSLTDGKRILVRGRIDRINRLGTGPYEVVDYKTGRFRRDEWQGVFVGGTRLQHAAYSVAANQLLRRRDPTASVIQGSYVFPTARGWRKRVDIPRSRSRMLESVLSDLCAVIKEGTFIHAPDEARCKWCEFGAACRPHAQEQARAKLSSSANKELDAFRRVRNYE
jgi:ATP-dependent helicase/nuclease subunit B